LLSIPTTPTATWSGRDTEAIDRSGATWSTTGLLFALGLDGQRLPP
jgi:hypothetical protein